MASSALTFKLNDDYISKVATWPDPFEGNPLGKFVYDRTYSRYKDDDTLETWTDTCRRVVEACYTLQKEHIEKHSLGWDDNHGQRSAQEMFERLYNHKFLASGRAMWCMGTDVVHNKELDMALFNCFSGDTEFFTKNGIMTFKDVVDEEVEVLTKNGNWKKAEVRQFGRQQLYEITFKPFGIRTNYDITYKATRNHRWILANGSTTENIKVGDTIMNNFDSDFSYINDIPNNREAFIHGLYFADGTRSKKYPNRYMIRLCGDKSQYQQLIESHPKYRTTCRQGDEPYITIVTDDINLKDLPPDNSSYEYKHAFLLGWMRFDGYKKPYCDSFQIDTINSNATQWVMDYAGVLGYSVVGYTTQNNDTNYGKRTQPLNRLSITFNKYKYKCVSIEEIGEEDVYCATEPVTGSFTLVGGLLTGNCSFISTKDIKTNHSMPFRFLMDVSMLGTGTGFDTKGSNTLKLYTPIFPPNQAGLITHVVEDTREGWVNALGALIDAYATPEHPEITFDYSLIRPEGMRLKTFGGKSSGAKPLKTLLENVRKVLDNDIENNNALLSTRGIVDIMNMIGVCVVAGEYIA